MALIQQHTLASNDDDNPFVTYDKIHVSKSTFLDGLNEPVHRWFRLTPSFAPSLVDEMLNETGTCKGSVVLDPFAGASTTLIQAKKLGLASYGFELNPFLYFVGTVCLEWNSNSEKINECIDNVKEKYVALQVEYFGMRLGETDLSVPTIKNVYRWWREDVLKDLLLLKKAICSISSETERNYMKVALAAALVPDLTNVTLGRLQLAFIDKSNVEMNVWETFEPYARRIAEDVDGVSSNANIQSKLFLKDSTQPVGDIIEPESVDCVITSPPYPNRYSYVWNTRPYMYFFDMIDDHKEASELDKKAIGGTWGSATSILDKGTIEPAFPILEEYVKPVVECIRDKDSRMANYVMKYFNFLTKQIVEMEPLLKPGAKCAYVVGCSEIKKVYVETDVLLGRVFEGLGFRTDEVKRFRKRNSGVDLYESIVYATY